MDISDQNIKPEWLEPIPVFFHNTLKDKLFNACSICECNLHEDKTYIIEKLVQKDEPLVEFALCTLCIENLTKSLSKESLEKLQKQENNFYLDKDLSHCMSCQKKEGECQRRVHVGMFYSRSYFKESHIWTCTDCIKEKQSQLSKKTRESLEDFNRDILEPFNSGIEFDFMPI